MEKHIKIFTTKSEYVNDENHSTVFFEGKLSSSAKARGDHVKKRFSNGFLDETINGLKEGSLMPDYSLVSDITIRHIDSLIDSLTSEAGRALIGLTIMQLSIKAICPEQSVRLHKGSDNSSSFSWVEGISMRSLDKQYVTPTLRKHNLLKLNADGFMMTRSLAENYPYTDLYKAKIRGASKDWLAIVDEIEYKNTDANQSLNFILSKLINSENEFENSCNELIKSLASKKSFFSSKDFTVDFLLGHFRDSGYAARLLEIGMHSLVQSSFELGAFDDFQLKPLSQMRSANKKHGNVADVEIYDLDKVVFAWDAKYGKSYLREEIEEIKEKISSNNEINAIGFVTSSTPIINEEIQMRLEDISSMYGLNISIQSFSQWVDEIFSFYNKRGEDDKELSSQWIENYVGYITQKRRDVAPIDEPCKEWVNEFQLKLNSLS